MPISYDSTTKRWNIQYEKQDHPVLNTVSITRNVPVGYKQVLGPAVKGQQTYTMVPVFEDRTATVDVNGNYQDIINALNAAGIPNPRPWDPENDLKTAQLIARQDNDVNRKRNEEAEKTNNLYNKINGYAKVAEPGNYLTYKKLIEDTNVDKTVKENAKSAFDSFYKTEVVSPWDIKTGAKVPFEGFENTIRFDPEYYGSTSIGENTKTAWENAVKEGDLDLLGRYPNYEAYSFWHYSNVGQNEAKKRGARDPGFKPQAPTDGFDYEKVEETVPGKTDAARQFERDKLAGDILGLKQAGEGYELKDVISQYENLVNGNKDLQDKWKTAKSEILYAERFPGEDKKPWAKLYEAVKDATGGRPDIQSAAGFGELLSKAYKLDSDKYPGAKALITDIQADKNIGTIDTKLSEYDVAFSQIATEAEKKRTEQAGELQKQFLEDSRRALIEAKQKEQKFDLLSGTSFGQEILGMRENIANSLIQESGVGGILGLTGKKQADLGEQLGLSLDTGKVFGSNNGILYNWEKWFFDEIEKKYSGGLDVPNDYVPAYQRNVDNGFVTPEQIKSWKQYDDAYETLKKDPGNLFAQRTVNPSNLPKDYIPVDKRKTTKQEWLDYETKRKAFLDDPSISEERKADIQFTQDFFNDYLLPRFNASKSISEFRDYINVDKDKQNIFQTEDRLTSLRNAAQAASASWMKALDALSPSKFNADYYFDPAGYYLNKGVGGKDDAPVLLGEQFQKEWGNQVPEEYVKQKQDIETTWEKAKAGETTKDNNGNDINWQAKAYLYGFDINNKEDFAKLHYEVLGQTKNYDSAPDVFNPKIAQIYLKQVLTPYLADKYKTIGTVFGQFADPDKFADDFVNTLDPLKNKEQTEKVLKLYGLDPNTEDLTELKKMISESIRSSDAISIREQIKKLNEASETPTQELLGVEYIQRASDKREEAVKVDDALYNRFKSAGYQGTQDDFYKEFMPDVTEEDKDIYQAAFSKKSLAETYKFKPTGDPFSDLGQIENLSSFGEETDKTTQPAKTSTATAAKPKSKYFSFFPDEEDASLQEEEESSPVKIKRGSDILAEFKSRLNLSPTAGKSKSTDLSDPFSSSFFGSF